MNRAPFLILTDSNGMKIAIDTEEIFLVQESQGYNMSKQELVVMGCEIHLRKDKPGVVFVKESFETICFGVKS